MKTIRTAIVLLISIIVPLASISGAENSFEQAASPKECTVHSNGVSASEYNLALRSCDGCRSGVDQNEITRLRAKEVSRSSKTTFDCNSYIISAE